MSYEKGTPALGKHPCTISRGRLTRWKFEEFSSVQNSFGSVTSPPFHQFRGPHSLNYTIFIRAMHPLATSKLTNDSTCDNLSRYGKLPRLAGNLPRRGKCGPEIDEGAVTNFGVYSIFIQSSFSTPKYRKKNIHLYIFTVQYTFGNKKSSY